jgi:hypothetical protein
VISRAVVLMLVFALTHSTSARAQDAGVRGEGLVLEVVSGVVTVPSGAVRSVDAGVYLDDEAAVRIGRELAAARAELLERRKEPPGSVPLAATIVGAVCLLAGFTVGFLVR